jgi:hypothetical protein
MATVKFISHVEPDGLGGWFIKLTDTFDNKEVICKDLDEYKEKIEDMGSEYGNDIEVQWTRSQLLTAANYEDIEAKMAKLQEEYQEEIDKINQKNEEINSGFNPNA